MREGGLEEGEPLVFERRKEPDEDDEEREAEEAEDEMGADGDCEEADGDGEADVEEIQDKKMERTARNTMKEMIKNFKERKETASSNGEQRESMQHQSLNQQMHKIASSDDDKLQSVQPEKGGQHSVAEAQKKESSRSNDKSSNAMQRVGRFNLKANTITEDEMVEVGEHGRTRGNHSKDAGVEVI